MAGELDLPLDAAPIVTRLSNKPQKRVLGCDLAMLLIQDLYVCDSFTLM
jgi:hypothetical protein